MDRLLQFLFQRFIQRGNFQITTSRGTILTFGDGTGTPVAVRFTTRSAEWALVRDPELKLGECYMDGTFVVERGTIADMLALALNQPAPAPQWSRMQWLMRFIKRRVQMFNPRRRAHKNAAHHYDLDGRLYSLFLDADRQYSCAYFENLNQSLDDAQLAKRRHLTAKLLIEKDQKVLDIGCGWGGLGLYIAEIAGGNVTGITLSQEQLAIANERAAEKHLADRAAFRLQDYRDVNSTFDRIVSVGMFEHVGVGYYDAFFRKCAALLDDKGVMLLHSIGRPEGPGTTNPWIAKYIFPGGYIPALSEVLPAIERAGLLVTDIEVLRLHYAETLKHWRMRFLAHQDDLQRSYDPRFVRMWEFYLASSEMAFRHQNMMNFQIQITKRQDVVPIVRDYIAREKHRLRRLETATHPPLRLAGE